MDRAKQINCVISFLTGMAGFDILLWRIKTIMGDMIFILFKN